MTEQAAGMQASGGASGGPGEDAAERPAPSAAGTPARKTIRILSANLWNGRVDPEAFADLVDALAIDVAAVQEMTPEQGYALANVLPHGELQPDRRNNGMGIVMGRPAKMSSIPMHCRDARVAHLEPSEWPELDEPLEIINIHIVAPQVMLPKPSFVIRPHQVRILREHIGRRRDAQRVVLGDLNSTPLWPAYWRIKSHLTDAAVAVARKTGRSTRRTWGPWPRSPRLIRIDHGFVSGLEVHGFDVVEIPGGDHNAIVMEVSPAGAGTAGRVGDSATGEGAGASDEGASVR
jgi:endonuclease/exonuclease/phosphatase family metal-dependent hydrolase